MKKLASILSIIVVIFLTSCSDKMYVQAPCDLQDLNTNLTIAQELEELGDNNAKAQTAQLDLSINFGTGENYKVQIYTANPDEEGSYLVGYYMLNDASTTNLLCNLPESLNNLYVSVTDSEGHRSVQSIAMLNGKADVMFGTMMASAK